MPILKKVYFWSDSRLATMKEVYSKAIFIEGAIDMPGLERQKKSAPKESAF